MFKDGPGGRSYVTFFKTPPLPLGYPDGLVLPRVLTYYDAPADADCNIVRVVVGGNIIRVEVRG